MVKNPQIVIGVPGKWANRTEIVTSIAKRSDGYLFAGLILMHVETKNHFKLEIYDHDPSLEGAFAIAGRGRLAEKDLSTISTHTFTLYVIKDGGTVEAGKQSMHAARALLKAGGLAVKVESSGIAHSAEQWTQSCDAHYDFGALLRAFVTFVGSSGQYYSCGMHNLGYRDAVVEADISPDDAAHLLHTFLVYLLVENPSIHNGETFSVDEHAPIYRLFEAECDRFEADDLFHNPYGIWKLKPAS